MGYFIGMDQRQFFVDDDGKWYSGKDKKMRINPETFEAWPSENIATVTTAVSSGDVHVHLGTKEANELTCEVCGYQSKTMAGLGAHKRTHKE